LKSEIPAEMFSTSRKLALGSALRVSSLVATALVSLVMMPFIVHSLGDRMYGIWTVVATLVGYYGLLDLGLSSAVARFLAAALGAQDQEQCNEVFNTSLRMFTTSGFIVLVIGCISAAVFRVLSKEPADAAIFWKVIVLVSITLAISFPIKVFGGILEAHLRFDRTTSIEILSLGLRNGLIFVALLMGFKVVGLAWAILLASIPINLAFVYFAYRDLPFLRIERNRWQWKTARALYSYSIFSFVASLANVLRFQVDNFVVASFVGLAAVTHYRIAGALSDYYVSFMTAVFGVFTSVFSRQEGSKDFDSLRKTFFFASKMSVIVSSFVGFGLLAWGKPFIARWMGPKYLDAYPCLVILVLGCTTALWQTPSMSVLYGISKHKFLALFTSIEGLVNLLLSLLLVRKYGILGVALGTFIPMAVVKLFVQPVYVCKVLSIDPLQYFRQTGRTLMFISGSLVIPYLLSARFGSPNYKILVFLGVISLICYTLPLLAYELSPTEARMLRQAIWPGIPSLKTPPSRE
jgi:O-antigen/teichoic acid export membrane protein